MAYPPSIDDSVLGTNPNEKLTVSEICAELKIARFYVLRVAAKTLRPTLHPAAQPWPADRALRPGRLALHASRSCG